MSLVESLFLLLSLFLGIRVFQDLFFWIYLWQRKEYRWDRLRVHFTTAEGRKDLKGFLNFSRQNRWPRFTLRSGLIFVIAFLLLSNGFFILLKNTGKFLLPIFEDQFSLSFFLTALIFWLLIPLMVILGVCLTGAAVFLVEKIIFFLAKRKIEKVKPLVIGISGSFGKTATKEILAQILEKKYRVLTTSGNENTKLGIALRVIKDLKEQEIFIVEMAAYRQGEIRSICQLVKPKVAILTGIDSQHQALFGSLENIKAAKYELIKALPGEGKAFFNGNNQPTKELREKTKNIATQLYGLGRPLKLPKWARIYQENVKAALAVATYLKIDQEQAFETAGVIKPFGHSLRIKKGKGGAVLLADSYNLNPAGFRRLLKFLEEEFASFKKLVITPGIIELGEAEKEIHKRIGKEMREIAAEVVLTSANFRNSLALGYGKEIKVYEDKEKLANFLKRKLKKKTVILFAGRVAAPLIKGCEAKVRIRIRRIRNKQVWEKYLKTQPRANFLHSFSWGAFQEKLAKKVFRLGVYQEGRLRGVSCLIKEKAKRGDYLSGAGGPLLSDWQEEASFPSLVEAIKKIGRQEKVRFIRIRPQLLDNEENRQFFKKAGFRSAPMHLHAENTWQLELFPDEEALLMKMRKSTRYNIRRAKKLGVKIEKVKNLKGLDKFYRLQLETAARQNFVPFSKRFLKEQFKIFKKDNQVLLLKASYKGRILAMSFFIFYGQEVAYHYSATDQLALKIPAAYLLLWEAIREAKKREFKIFNFWGIAPDNRPSHRFAGVTFFKKGFSGFRLDYLHAQDLPLSWTYIFTFIFETIRKIRRDL